MKKTVKNVFVLAVMLVAVIALNVVARLGSRAGKNGALSGLVNDALADDQTGVICYLNCSAPLSCAIGDGGSSCCTGSCGF